MFTNAQMLQLTFPDGKPEISRAFSTRLRSSLFCVNILIILKYNKYKFIYVFMFNLHIFIYRYKLNLYKFTHFLTGIFPDLSAASVSLVCAFCKNIVVLMFNRDRLYAS